MPILPDGTMVIDDAPNDDVHYGRHKEEWRPVVEEAPNEPGKSYVRNNHEWIETSAATAGITVTEIVPTMATVGLSAALPAKVYGTGFTDPAQVTWNGANIPTSFISDTELSITIDTTLGTAPSVATVAVVGATGAVGFHFVSSGGQYHFVVGLTHDTVTGDVNLQPAGDGPPTLGGVYVIDRVRNATEGLELGLDGRLRAPLATPRLAGTIVEPEDDGKGYVRTTLNGVSMWVPPADTPSVFAGLGLSMDETSTPFTMNLQPAGFGDPKFLGGIYEPPMDGMAYSRQYDATTNTWSWVPALTAGLQITGLIPDKAVLGGDVVTVRASGSEFTPTCVLMLDGADIATTYVSPTELTFQMNPKVPTDPISYVVTVRDTATVPAPGTGLGAEEFEFIVASIQVDYGTGLAFDTTTDPPIVNLQPAQDAANAIGGVYVVDRERNVSEGLELGIDGRLRAPLATPRLAGTIVEPEDDGKGYVRTTLNGVSMWVPPATTQTHYVLGLTHDEATGDVNLTPAGWAPEFLGGVYTNGGRSATEGLDLAAAGTGQISAPLATYLLAGTIVEPPADDKGYVRRTLANGQSSWVPPADTPLPDFGTGLSIQDGAPGDPQIVHLTPAGLTPELLGGVWVPPRGALQGLEINTAQPGMLVAPPATDQLAGVIVEPPVEAGQLWGRTTSIPGTGKWEKITAVPTDYGTGLSLDETQSPQIVHLQPAGPQPQFLGGVWVPARNENQGLQLGTDGRLIAPNATDLLAGVLREPPPGTKQYARKHLTDGTKLWAEIEPNTGGINDVPQQPVAEEYVRSYNRWVPVEKGNAVQPRKVNISGDVMTGLLILSGNPTDLLGAVPLQMLNEVKQYVDAQDTADRLWVENYYADKAPPGGPYWMLDGAWSNIPASATATYGIGIDLEGGVVNLKPANFNGEIGGVTVVARSPLQGLEYDLATGTLWAPLATNLLPGVITEPVADGKGYVRASQPDGSYQWVPPAPSGGGCTISDTPPLNPQHEDLWWESDSGTMFIYYDDGTSAQWVQTDASPEMPSYGIGIDLEGGAVNLKPANFNGEIGGVKVVGRSPLNGLDYDPATGTLWSPPGTDVLAGSIVEPPKDGKPYARSHDDMNGARWTETSNGAVIIADDPPATPPTPGALWWDSNAGSLAVFYQDGDLSQWVQVNGSQSSGDYLPLTGGTMVGPIVLPSADPTLPEHATHKKYVDVAIANQALYQSTWQVATNVPDLTVAVANPLHGYSWTAVTANAAVPETAPAGLPGIGGTSIASGDTIKYNATLLLYEHIKTASSAGGIGDAPSDTTTYGRVDATWVNVLPLTGGTVSGVITVQNSPANGAMKLFPGDATNNGRIDWNNPDGTRKAYIGYAGTTTLQINLDGATRLDVKGGSVFVDATANCGYLFGDTWHGMYFHGGNTLAFTEYHDRFEWRHQNSGTVPGGTVRMSLYGGNLSVAGNAVITGNINTNLGLGVAGNSTLTGTVTMAARSVHNGGIKVPEANNIEFADGNHTINGGPNAGGIIHRTNGNHWFFVDGVHVFEIDDSGGSWPTVMRGADQLARDLNVAKSERGSVSILNTMIAMAAKIKELEAKIAACCDGK